MKEEMNPSTPDAAFSRLELVMVLATVGLLAGLALPLLANNKFRSEQVSCLSNLRQAGHALHLWANEHGDRNHWWTHIRDGGTYYTPGDPTPTTWSPIDRNNAWFQWAFISNELRTPKILVCRADQPKVIANTFTDFYNLPTFKNGAVSYFIGLHSFFASPRSILSGDRNVRWGGLNNGCSAQVGLTYTLNVPNSFVRWTNAIHGTTGNLLFTDGGVEQMSIRGLERAVNFPAQNENGSLHFIVPP